jgi:hypothetical protein
MAGEDSSQTTAAYVLLGSVTPNARTSFLNIGAVKGYYIYVTGTAAVRVMYSDTTISSGVGNTSDHYVAQYTIGSNDYAVLTKKFAPYVRFQAVGAYNAQTGVTPFASVKYITITPGTTSIGTVTLGAGTAIIGNIGNTVVGTADAALLAGQVLQPTSPTASLLSGYLSLSETGRSINSGDTALALTSLAGSATGVFWAEFSTLGGPSCTGVYYDMHQNATAPLYYHYLAASATAIVYDHQAAGQHLHLVAPTGATCTCKVAIGKRTVQAP